MPKTLKRILKIIAFLVLIPIIYVVGVLGFAYLTDYQPAEHYDLAVEKPKRTSVSEAPSQKEFTLMTWNIGFGGLGKEMDFFYDGGTQMRSSEAVVEKNLQGIGQTLSDSIDFIFLQEIDKKAKRSYQKDEIDAVDDNVSYYNKVFGKNYDVKFVPKPYLEPMGNVVSGILTLSRFPVQSAEAFTYKNTYHFPDYLFYLDRCFTCTRVPLADKKELILINSHNSAYDPEGKMKAFELEQLKTFLLAEYQKGNYVIVGADWNMYPPDFKEIKGFKPESMLPACFAPQNYPANEWKWIWDNKRPSNRHVGEVYNPQTTYQTIIDYFLISPNVESLYVKTIDNGFDFADHQPVQIKVRLK